jgi:hypothetical protein
MRAGAARRRTTPFGRPLRLAGKGYDTGLGVLANSRLEVRNRGQARFVATVGIDDSATARGRRVVFEVTATDACSPGRGRWR